MNSAPLEPSTRLQLALLGVVILNMAIGIIHLIRGLFWTSMNVWALLPVVTGLITLFMSWQLLQLADHHLVNFGFQLGVLWAFATLLFDLGLYLIPRPGGLINTIGSMADRLIIHYGTIILVPTIVGAIYWVRELIEGQSNGK